MWWRGGPICRVIGLGLLGSHGRIGGGRRQRWGLGGRSWGWWWWVEEWSIFWRRWGGRGNWGGRWRGSARRLVMLLWGRHRCRELPRLRSLGRRKTTTFEFDEENGFFFCHLNLGFMCVGEYRLVCSVGEIWCLWSDGVSNYNRINWDLFCFSLFLLVLSSVFSGCGL